MSKSKISYVTIIAMTLTVLLWILPYAYSIIIPDDGRTSSWKLPENVDFCGVCLLLSFLSFLFGIAALSIELRRKSDLGIVLCIISVMLILGAVIYWVDKILGKEDEQRWCYSCVSNLKSISISLQLYASDNHGYYPPENGAAGLAHLRNYGAVYAFRHYHHDTGTVPVKSGEPLTENNVDYVYIGGLNEKSDPKLPLMYDKSGNHKNYKNILYVNGEIKDSSGNPPKPFSGNGR